MEDFLKEIGIDEQGNYSDDGCYIIDLDEKNFFRYESILDKSELIDLDEDSSNITYEAITKQYDSDNYLITLIGDLEGNTYRLSCKQI